MENTDQVQNEQNKSDSLVAHRAEFYPDGVTRIIYPDPFVPPDNRKPAQEQ